MLRNQDLPKQSSCISKLMVLLYCTDQFWLVPWSVALVSQTTWDDVYHITCIDLWIFFFHYSIMYYNMYCYHVASIHNQSWTGLLIMETVDQSVSCNLVGVFFFSISMQSFIVQLSEIRNFMISFVITSKYLHVYDKEIFDLKPIGHAFTCHIGIIKSVHIYYCTHVYMYLKKKKRFILNVYMKVKSCLSYTGDGIASDLTSDPSFLLEACGRHGAMEKGDCHMATAKCNICRVLTPLPPEGTL